MSVVSVPVFPPRLRYTDIRSSENVRGGTWRAASDLINYLTAKGGQLVVANQPNLVISSGGTGTLRYYAWPRLLHSRRVWILYMSASSGGAARCAVTVTDGATDPAEYRVPITPATNSAWNQIVDPPMAYTYVGKTTPTDTPGEITLTIDAAGAGLVVQRVACFELPRTRILIGNGDDAAGYAGPGFAIYQTNETGIYGVAQACEAGRTTLRRANLHWFNSTGFTTTSGSFTPVFNLPPKILGTRGSAADGTTVDVAVAARLASAGGNGELRLTMASGDTLTLTSTSGTPAWYTGTITIDREDLADTDSGGQAARLFGDAVTVEARKTTGTSITVTGLGISKAL